MSARGVLLKFDARRDSSIDQLDHLDRMLSPRSPQILINDYFVPEGQGNESPGIHVASGGGGGVGAGVVALSHSQENLVAGGGLPNEISAPYEVPQFPIEQIENKLQLQRQLNAK
ncbi:hypothetical protein pipiens_015227 [Culex pipiens pipiens]|uniref:Uncharacterized protein n=3 Tax=Culex pipiens TaxID=7175 RepID=A0ABD1CRL2_CULPP